METNETPKRKQRTVTKPYQKHKSDYKISVQHKMRELKNEYVLYVEIRAKGQITLAKSRFWLKASDEVTRDNAMSNSFIIKCLEYEKKSITDSIKAAIDTQKESFVISRWLNFYRLKVTGPSLYDIVVDYLRYQFKEVFVQKGIIINEIFEETDYEYGIDDFGRMASICSQLGHKEFDNITEMALLFWHFFGSISFSGRNFPAKEITHLWVLHLEESLFYQDVITGFLKTMLTLAFESGLSFSATLESKEKVNYIIETIERMFKDKGFDHFMEFSNGEHNRLNYFDAIKANK